MPEITFSDGKVVMVGDKVGTGPECCCGGGGGCESCTKSCCLFVQSRSIVCSPGSASATMRNESWGDNFLGGGWYWNAYDWSATGNFSQGDNFQVEIWQDAVCADGQWYLPVVYSLSSRSGESGQSQTYWWYDVAVTAGGDGCQASVTLGAPHATECGPSGCGSTTPVTPTITWACS